MQFTNFTKPYSRSQPNTFLFHKFDSPSKNRKILPSISRIHKTQDPRLNIQIFVPFSVVHTVGKHVPNASVALTQPQKTLQNDSQVRRSLSLFSSRFGTDRYNNDGIHIRTGLVKLGNVRRTCCHLPFSNNQAPTCFNPFRLSTLCRLLLTWSGWRNGRGTIPYNTASFKF